MSKLHNLSGEQKVQLLIVCDKYGKKLGLATREKCHTGKGITHLAFVAFLKDQKDKIILARRSMAKSLWPGFWDAAIVSHILPEETAEEAANRRGREELGVEAEFKDLGAFYYHARQGNSAENEYCHVLSGDTQEIIHPNLVEIEEVKLLSIEELSEDIKRISGKYTPWLKLALTIYKTNG